MTRRIYRTERIVVHWDSSRCIHTGFCLRGLPAVFDVDHRPWVSVDGADADAIAATIETCPSGALTYQRLDGPGEQPQEVTTIVPWPNGPLWVRGNIEVRDARGDLFDAGPRATLCRCGRSENQPFCDLTHRETGFRDIPHASSRQRDMAVHPAEITEEPTA